MTIFQGFSSSTRSHLTNLSEMSSWTPDLPLTFIAWKLYSCQCYSFLSPTLVSTCPLWTHLDTTLLKLTPMRMPRPYSMYGLCVSPVIVASWSTTGITDICCPLFLNCSLCQGVKTLYFTNSSLKGILICVKARLPFWWASVFLRLYITRQRKKVIRLS
jgi:hypothetical protein